MTAIVFVAFIDFFFISFETRLRLIFPIKFSGAADYLEQQVAEGKKKAAKSDI